ncbi:hypothetical protein DPEC_G00192280 [Dallia pectoralis]|uniref:Uncharacterized protein n=1 Tax=Dallia pectoralis TaxID=75939 RepID=A0ACC2GCN5_DALPE|nr:hypothetical protein DPEC_G00192280 [Dallia pectoralis]
MAAEDIRTTLSYNKSPEDSRRTTFQAELEAAVSARASKTKTEQHSYSDESDDGDDVLKELLNSRKKRIDAFKVGKNRAKVNDFNLSDDEEENKRPKKVSFMKTRTDSSHSPDLAKPDTHKNNLTNISMCVKHSESHHQVYSRLSAPDDSQIQSSHSLLSQPSQTESQFQSSLEKNGHLNSPLPLPFNNDQIETLVPYASENSLETEEHTPCTPQPSHRGTRCTSLTDSVIQNDDVIQNEPPRPKPRHRTLRASDHTQDDPTVFRGVSPSRTLSSSVSISFSSTDKGEMTSTNITTSSSKSTAGSCSPNGPEGDCAVSSTSIKSSAEEVHVLEDNQENDGKNSTSFQEYQEDSADQSDHISRLSHVSEKSGNTRPSSSLTKSLRKSHSGCSYTAQSKYLGSLKVLDCEVQLHDGEPEAADSLRAAIYQEWLKKKTQKVHQMMRIKKHEEMLKEDKRKRDEQVKIDDAKASYEAWKENKAKVIKAKVKEKQDVIKEKQREVDEQEEKRESAKKIFEKWKQEHDELLKEKYRKKKEAENKLKQIKEEKEEERRRDAMSAISSWNERKKVVVLEQVKTERQKEKIKEEEERYEKEEKDRMALEMYETWLRKKERQQTRQRKERQIQAILQDDPPPPWSPPSKTVPFGK